MATDLQEITFEQGMAILRGAGYALSNGSSPQRHLDGEHHDQLGGEHHLEVLSARALCELPDADRDAELLGPLVVRGNRTVIGASTGHGKTTFEVQMARAISEGTEFLGWQGTRGRVLFIDAEQGLRTIKRRLAEAGLKDSTAVDFLRVPDGLALDRSQADREQLEAVLSVGGYDVVFADPLYKLHTGDSNAERDAVDGMKVWDGWRDRFGFGLVLAVHCRKPPPGAKFTMHELFGSSAYLRGAEVVLGLERLRPGYSRLHFLKDRDGDLPAGDVWGLVFDRETGFARDPHDGEHRPVAAEKVRDALETSPGMTLEQLADAVGCSSRTVREALGKLGGLEVTGAHGRKFWSLPADDRDAR